MERSTPVALTLVDVSAHQSGSITSHSHDCSTSLLCTHGARASPLINSVGTRGKPVTSIFVAFINFGTSRKGTSGNGKSYGIHHGSSHEVTRGARAPDTSGREGGGHSSRAANHEASGGANVELRIETFINVQTRIHGLPNSVGLCGFFVRGVCTRIAITPKLVPRDRSYSRGLRTCG